MASRKIHGIPSKNDFMDEHIIQFMIDKGFSIGIHGHQHKSDLVDVKFYADYKQGMIVFGCGTLSAPAPEVPYGETTVSILEIDREQAKLRYHVRKPRTNLLNSQFGCQVTLVRILTKVILI